MNAALRAASTAKVVHGPEAFTPDGAFLLGETAVRGFWVAAGFCVHGLAAAGGVGKVMAEWIVDGIPEWDMSTMDIRRFGARAASRSWATAKALDARRRLPACSTSPRSPSSTCRGPGASTFFRRARGSAPDPARRAD